MGLVNGSRNHCSSFLTNLALPQKCDPCGQFALASFLSAITSIMPCYRSFFCQIPLQTECPHQKKTDPDDADCERGEHRVAEVVVTK